MKKLVFMCIMSGCMGLTACNAFSKSGDNVSEEVAVPVVSDSIRICKGTLVIGHEVFSFMPEGDTLVYWVVDCSGELKKRYEAALAVDSEPYTPVPAKLKLKMLGPSSEGFAAQYDGVVEVQEIMMVGE